MGYYSYTAKTDGFTAVETNCFVNLCPSSDKNQTTIEVVMAENSYIARHNHIDNDEFLFLIDGEVTEIETGKIFKTGQSLTIPRKKFHGFKSENGCKMKIIFKPKMK